MARKKIAKSCKKQAAKKTRKKAVKKKAARKKSSVKKTRPKTGGRVACAVVQKVRDQHERGKQHVREQLQSVEEQRAAEGIVRRRASRMDASDIEVILGSLPAIVDPRRRARCGKSLELYLRTYSPEIFFLPFGQEHKNLIARLQEAMLESLWDVEVFPRGYGKTEITKGAARWAISYGHKKFLPILGSGKDAADEIIAGIKGEFECNDLLYEDFPEICHPIRALEGAWQRCGSQRYRGEMTNIQWKGNKVIFPTIEGSKASGSILLTGSWKSRIRGMSHRMPDGSVARPDAVLIDDPQTDEMAASQSQCTKFLNVLQGAILGLGGHGKKISVVMPATIICAGDAIDRLADQKEYPAWIVGNIPMLKELPKNIDMWLGDYAKIREDFDRDDPASQRKAAAVATKFYRKNRKKMDDGAVASWKECYSEGEISAVQHAMNIWIDRGEDFFNAECQGKPTKKIGGGALVTDVDFLAKKINGLGRRILPASTNVVTGFIDVAHSKLQFMLCGFDLSMAGSIVEYGEWPRGRKTLQDYKDRNGQPLELSAAICKGIQDLVEDLTSLPLPKTDKESLPVREILIDCGDPATRDAVFQMTRGARFNCRVIASRGRAHHKFKLPDPKKKLVFQDAYLDRWNNQGYVVVHDACLWRERTQRSLMAPVGGSCGIDIYGVGKDRHRELATQCFSERLLEKLVGTTGEMYKWMRVPGTRNHFLDCAVGCLVAATLEGVRYGREEKGGKENRRPQGVPQTRRRKKRGGFKAVDG